MNTEYKIVEQCKNIIQQLILLGTTIPTPLDGEESDWDYVKWLNKCAIENLEMTVQFIEELREGELE